MSDFPIGTEVLVIDGSKKGIKGFITDAKPTHHTHQGKIPVRYGARNEVAWIEPRHLKNVSEPQLRCSEFALDDKVINVTPMSLEEARECLNAIKQNIGSLRLMVLDFKRRDGWKALGYKNWAECAQAEFNQSRAYIFRLVQAAEVEENLKSTIVDSVLEESTIVDILEGQFTLSNQSTIVDSPSSIPTNQLAELAKLPPEHQADGLREAERLALSVGKKRTRALVTEAVKHLKEKLLLGGETQLFPDKKRNDAPDVDKTKVQEFHFMVNNLPVKAITTLSAVVGLPRQIEFYGVAVSETGYRCFYVQESKIAEHSSERAFLIKLATEFHMELQPVVNFQVMPLVKFQIGDRIKILRHAKYSGKSAIVTRIHQNTLDCKPDDGTDHLYLCSPRIEDVELASQCNPNWTSAIDLATINAAIDQVVYIPERLTDCTNLEEVAAYLEQAAPSEVWAEFQGLLKKIAELEKLL